ncbi:MAG: ATP-binding cassette domain-containing protein [Salibacteraceae bacterium]|jgi:ABC transport system ATP-binding/permease protein|nr:ATP-binding cassette domain-containing protein [Salibacteraceae bacterium]MDP4685354.1 ATP-binding cassette domain-containing protein [Salibacteraceae bacterium]MDP4764227.1 ATP-binding cassette domain-containing protein [Salibacteraceae bacterium]MDP4963424.1 ATP-binding cassette domain-containing protein [Salibacteraceae bacterium]
MSEKLLKALMELFAIIAEVDTESEDNKSRIVVEQFLKQRLSKDQVVEYLKIYDDYLETHHKVSQKKEGKRKKTAVNSVKVLKICTQINGELEQKQKVFVLLRLVEYINIDNFPSEQELEFVDTVSEVFNIPNQELKDIKDFVTCNESNLMDSERVLIINQFANLADRNHNKHIFHDTLTGNLAVLSVESVNMYALKFFGNQELLLNGQIIAPEKTYILTQGSSIRSTKVTPIYYSDIISTFLSDKSESKIVFAVDNITYRFKGGKIGLHPLNFSEESGKLIGIMGASGSGKSTLLNILNGNYTPFSGAVKINGYDIHHDRDNASGMIGYISQDDLLIEELTVYQNLFLNAKLCFDGLTDDQIKERADDTLKALGLFEIKDIQVGNPMNKKISGGQRKRLNCALELIREPSVLFVDEPTSGLSSRDSENIMDLLKELALKGKLIFVVIHQPSSEIFKMFDKLLILDTGGFPIYLGNPLDAIVYFKTEVNALNPKESECVRCGNVNPEQIFNIIEAKVVDEYGNLTDKRKTSPSEWNKVYLERQDQRVSAEEPELPEVEFKTPNVFNQLKVFVTRDVLSKITNKQYLAINLLEAPLLGFILSYFLRYILVDDGAKANEYVFYSNDNMIVYMFMAVIVALFLGLTVSAEEIFKDQKIRKRESFLHLSNGSYLMSKIGIMFLISAIQMFLFILVGNYILGIQGMLWDYWLILFSLSCFANMLGLNISASFNSAVTIYILIPFLIIPQILFSGVLVKFEKLNPTITSQRIVPIIGEVMASRWAFEALAVNQFKNNEYEKLFFDFDQQMSEANFKKNFWIPAIKAKIGKFIEFNKDNESYTREEIERDLTTVRQELAKQNLEGLPIEFDNPERFTIDNLNQDLTDELSTYLATINKLYIRQYNANSDAKDQMIRDLQSDEKSKEAFNTLRNDYENESLSDLVTNKNEFNQVTEYDGKLIQRADPVFNIPDGFRSHFYAPSKQVFGKSVSTKNVNVMVLWLMCIMLAITLYFDGFKKLLDLFSNIQIGKN